MYYHASPVKGIHVLEPKISNHNIPLIYFSNKRENVLVYLSNAVEKFCRENNFSYHGTWSKWGPYGFDSEGKLQYEEYYPNALEETYKGVSGYIYFCADIEEKIDFELNISNVFVSQKCVGISGCEYVMDAYSEILQAEKKGLLKIVRFDDFISEREQWLCRIIKEEYDGAADHPEYRFFLENKFKTIISL